VAYGLTAAPTAVRRAAWRLALGCSLLAAERSRHALRRRRRAFFPRASLTAPSRGRPQCATAGGSRPPENITTLDASQRSSCCRRMPPWVAAAQPPVLSATGPPHREGALPPFVAVEEASLVGVRALERDYSARSPCSFALRLQESAVARNPSSLLIWDRRGVPVAPNLQVTTHASSSSRSGRP
jgi:hypothetical protein